VSAAALGAATAFCQIGDYSGHRCMIHRLTLGGDGPRSAFARRDGLR